MSAKAPLEIPTLLEACEHPQLFGVDLTAKQRELVRSVEAGGLLHAWALGRRSGKTLIATLIALYYCTLRPDLASFTRRRERRYSVAVATNARQSRINIRQGREIIDGSRFLTEMVDTATDDEIRFTGGTSFVAFPCTGRGGRGWPIMFLSMDEAAHFIDGDGNQAAEPVFRALMPSLLQFGPAARCIIASSPYGVDGWFAETFAQIEKGDLDGAHCVQAATLEVRPELASVALEMERRRNPESFRAEYGAEFVAAGGAYLDATRVAEAVRRRGELRAGQVVGPIAAVDLAFNADSSALVIVGRDKADPNRLRLVLARSWTPQPGKPLSFSGVLDEMADLCLEHRVGDVYADQFAAAASREHLERRGLRATIVPTTDTSKSAMFSDLKQRIYEGGIELFDQPDLLAELRRVETVTTPGRANVRIRRLGSSHGDLATALALACSKLRPSLGLGYRRGQGLPRSDVNIAPERFPGVRGRELARLGLADPLSAQLGSYGIPTFDTAAGLHELQSILDRAAGR